MKTKKPRLVVRCNWHPTYDGANKPRRKMEDGELCPACTELYQMVSVKSYARTVGLSRPLSVFVDTDAATEK